MSGKGEMNLNDLGLEQLGQLREKVEGELQQLRTAYGDLQVLRSKVVNSKDALKVFQDRNKDEDILVPLSSSMYVMAKQTNISTVSVDIGTGFYIDKPIPEAQAYLDRRIEMLVSKLEDVEKAINVQRRNISGINQVMQSKIAASIQAQS